MYYDNQRTLNNRGGMIGDLFVNDSQNATIIRSTPPTVSNDIVAGEFPEIIVSAGIEDMTDYSQLVSL